MSRTPSEISNLFAGRLRAPLLPLHRATGSTLSKTVMVFRVLWCAKVPPFAMGPQFRIFLTRLKSGIAGSSGPIPRSHVTTEASLSTKPAIVSFQVGDMALIRTAALYADQVYKA